MLPIGIGGNTVLEYNITDSLRFRSSASANLTYQNKTATDRTAWTYSVWVKRSRTGVYDTLFAFRTAGSAYSELWFTSADNLRFSEYNGAVIGELTSTAVYRDTSAWYHIVLVWDSANATSTDRCRLYVNGDRITSFSATGFPAQNTLTISSTPNQDFVIGRENYSPQFPFDGYMTEINSVDGQALDPTSFGETNDDGVWQPKKYTGTYGTNGFYLPMKETTQATGFNTVLFDAQNSSQSITGVGFSPDLIWLKDRTAAITHLLHDTIRGPSKYLSSSSTNAEATASSFVTSFDSDGFTLNSNGTFNAGDDIVAWCWDAGSSTVSNTDGSITSSVRANPATGFSVVSYTCPASGTYTVGHGLGTAPALVIVKDRGANNTAWFIYHKEVITTVNNYLSLQTSDAILTANGIFGSTLPNDTLFSSTANVGIVSGNAAIAYCFSEVSGYSKFGSYTGNGSTSGPTVTTGFRPAFVMVKRTDTTGSWRIFDSTRSVDNPRNDHLKADGSDVESVNDSALAIDFNDTGFQLVGTGLQANASGGTYIYMAFADTRDYQWNFDASGNKNNWTPNNINSNASSETTYDLMSDTPSLVDEDTSNFATWNGVAIGTDATLSNGNLDCAYGSSSGTRYGTPATMGMSSGKWYWEIEVTASSLAACTAMIAITNKSNPIEIGQYAGVNTYGWAYYGNAGTKVTNDAGVAYGASYGVGDVIGVSFDADAGNLVFYKNGVSQGTAFTGLTNGPYFPAIGDGSFTNTFTVSANFGQRPFAYTPPTGYKKLNTFNLPDSSITDGSDYFNTVLYTGNGSTQSITGVGFSPDFSWFKARDVAYAHQLVDSVRGAGYPLFSNLTNQETYYGTVSSFDSDGVTLDASTYAGTNGSGTSFVSWHWRGSDSTAVSNTDGTITSTVSANTTSGFSVVTFNAAASGAFTVGHGLGTAPKVVITRYRNIASEWYTYHESVGNTKYLKLNDTAAETTSSTIWDNTSPTSDVFTLGSSIAGSSSWTMVAYCFAEVEGFSKFGSFTGNGSADGAFIYLGFRPAFVMVKQYTTTGNWIINDSGRAPYNLIPSALYPNLSNAEDSSHTMDLLSNGFKLRSTGDDSNGSGTGIIYMAFAENPFKNSLAR